jgi:uridine kinase
VYEIAHDRAVRTERFFLGKSPVFVAEGLFAGDIAPACRERGILADAVVVWRKAVEELRSPAAARPG